MKVEWRDSMEQFLIFIVVIIVLYFISTRYSSKEAVKYLEEDNTSKESSKLEHFDPTLDAIIDVSFVAKNNSFLLTSKPNIIINGEKHKIIQDTLRLRVPTEVTYHFGLPYMKGESFKANGTFQFRAGHHYEVVFKAKVFVFQKPKIIITDLGEYKG